MAKILKLKIKAIDSLFVPFCMCMYGSVYIYMYNACAIPTYKSYYHIKL